MLTGRFGLSVHQHTNAWPHKAEQIRIGVNYLRVLVVDQTRLLNQLANDLAPGVKVIALINPQTPHVNPLGTPEGIDGWKTAIELFATDFAGKVEAVECLNEWDIGPKNSIDDVVQCAVDASPLLHAAGIKCLLGSVGGGTWRADLASAIARVDELQVRDLLDGVCTHPYVRPAFGVPPVQDDGSWGPPEVDEAVQMAFDTANPPGASRNLPVYVTEWGLPMAVDDPGDLQEQFVRNSLRKLGGLGEDVLAAACYYAYGDRSNPRARDKTDDEGREVYGLFRDDLSARGGANAFIGEATGVVTA
jgi:hypothetical protein